MAKAIRNHQLKAEPDRFGIRVSREAGAGPSLHISLERNRMVITIDPDRNWTIAAQTPRVLVRGLHDDGLAA